VGALTAIANNYSAVVMHLKEIGNGKGDDAATSKGLLKKMKTYFFVKRIHFLLHFLTLFKQLSLIFQKENLLHSQTKYHLDSTSNAPKEMTEAPQHFERKFIANVNSIGVYKGIQLMQAESYSNVERKKLIDEGIKYLIKRFGENESEIAKAVSVFDTFTWPEDLEGFGKEEIKI
jgi:hypothetical protein